MSKPVKARKLIAEYIKHWNDLLFEYDKDTDIASEQFYAYCNERVRAGFMLYTNNENKDKAYDAYYSECEGTLTDYDKKVLDLIKTSI